MQFDFALGAYQSTSLDVAGRFFKYKSGTGVIRVRATAGGYVDLLPGQGVRNIDFTGLTLTDKSGAANAGVILAGDFDFSDDRITGSVEVIDIGRARTLASSAYMFTASRAAAAGLLSHLELWNPVGSLKNVMIEKVILTTSMVGANVGMGFHNAQLSTSVGNIPISKRSNGGIPSQIVCYAQDSATALYPISMAAPGDKTIIALTAPLCIEPGYGLVFRSTQFNQDFQVTLELFEEPR